MRLWTVVALAAIAAGAERPSVRMDGGRFVVDGWAEADASLFTVYAGDGATPLLGAYSTEAGRLVFTPRFPVAVRTRAVLRLTPPVEMFFDAPATAAGEPTRVVRVYPTAAVLPANLLKLYVEFSAPMGRGDAWSHLALERDGGAKVDLPFLEVDQELWDRDYKRLTILFDPGRVKRGVLPNVEAGPALEAGKRYTLVVSRDWRDARGQPLAAEFRKPFLAAPDDRTPTDTSTWKLTPPRAGTRDPLIVDARESLDAAIFPRALSIPGVDGAAELSREESVWRFTPREPWKAGDHRLVVDTTLEDLAGNRVGRAFDVDVFERVTQRPERTTVDIRFLIR